MRLHLKDRAAAAHALKRRGVDTQNFGSAYLLRRLFVNIEERRADPLLIGKLLHVRIPLCYLVSFRKFLECYQQTDLRTIEAISEDGMVSRFILHLGAKAFAEPTDDVKLVVDPQEYAEVGKLTAARLAPLTERADYVGYTSGYLNLVFNNLPLERLQELFYQHYRLRYLSYREGYGFYDNSVVQGENGTEIALLSVPAHYLQPAHQEFMREVDAYARLRKLALPI